MTTKTKTKEPSKPLKTFRAFGIEASVWPPKAEYDDDRPKIRLSRGFRNKEGNFASTSYFAPEELAVAIEQAMKALLFTAPEQVDKLMEHLSDIVWQMRPDTANEPEAAPDPETAEAA
jgi:hypothetical protein